MIARLLEAIRSPIPLPSFRPGSLVHPSHVLKVPKYWELVHSIRCSKDQPLQDTRLTAYLLNGIVEMVPANADIEVYARFRDGSHTGGPSRNWRASLKAHFRYEEVHCTHIVLLKSIHKTVGC